MIATYARRVALLGGPGAGQLTKMVNQICIAGLVEGLAEGLHFAKAAGLDPAAVVDVISKGAAQSWQMENRSGTMLRDEYEHGFAVEWMRKDLAIALEEARRNGARLPVTALVDQLYGEIVAMGGKRWDTSSLLRRLERQSRCGRRHGAASKPPGTTRMSRVLGHRAAQVPAVTVGEDPQIVVGGAEPAVRRGVLPTARGRSRPRARDETPPRPRPRSRASPSCARASLGARPDPASSPPRCPGAASS